MPPNPYNVALPTGSSIPDKIDFTAMYSAVVDYIHMHGSFLGGVINDPRHVLKNSMWYTDRTAGIYTTQSVPLSDYDPDSAKPFGDPVQLKAELQLFTVEDTETWNVKSDYMYSSSTRNVLHPIKFMMQQMREQVTPNRDLQGFSEFWTFASANSLVNATVWDKASSIYDQILSDATHMFTTLKVNPRMGGRILMRPDAWEALKKDGNFKLATEIAQKDIVYNGEVAKVDGMTVVVVDSDRWNTNIAWMISMPYAAIQPFKANRNRVFYNHPDFIGWLSQHFAWLDCFITKNQGRCFYIRKVA